MARPVERPKHHRTPFEFTINVEDAFDYLDEFLNSPDYPKTGSEMGRITYTPNKHQILGDRLEARFGVDMVEARKIVSMWFERNNNLRTENKEIMKNIISERELKRMVKKVVREEKLNNINEDRTDFEMSGARSRRDYISNPRERDISSMFGKYAEDVPPIVIRYLRKNPEAIVKRLYKIYGDKIFDYLPQQEMEEGYDSYMDDVHEEEKWIQKAIEKPGSLRKKMGLKKGEKLTSSDIKSKLDSLKAKDKDPNKKGVQGLGKRDLKTYRQLNLAKTLRGL